MLDNNVIGVIIGVGLWFALAWVPAEIARSRKYSFWKWYAYGLLMFPVALVQSVSLQNRYRRLVPLTSKRTNDYKRNIFD